MFDWMGQSITEVTKWDSISIIYQTDAILLTWFLLSICMKSFPYYGEIAENNIWKDILV